MRPFGGIAFRRLDGFGVSIITEAEGRLVVTVTREADGLSWRGSTDTIDAAVLLAAKDRG